MHYIFSIEGNIGSGKSTLVKKLTTILTKLSNIQVIYLPEPVAVWESIKDKNNPLSSNHPFRIINSGIALRSL